MPSPGIASPEQLAMLTLALADYCRRTDIKSGTDAHEEAARLVMALFNNGAQTVEALTTALDVFSGRESVQRDQQLQGAPSPPKFFSAKVRASL